MTTYTHPDLTDPTKSMIINTRQWGADPKSELTLGCMVLITEARAAYGQWGGGTPPSITCLEEAKKSPLREVTLQEAEAPLQETLSRGTFLVTIGAGQFFSGFVEQAVQNKTDSKIKSNIAATVTIGGTAFFTGVSIVEVLLLCLFMLAMKFLSTLIDKNMGKVASVIIAGLISITMFLLCHDETASLTDSAQEAIIAAGVGALSNFSGALMAHSVFKPKYAHETATKLDEDAQTQPSHGKHGRRRTRKRHGKHKEPKMEQGEQSHSHRP